MPKHDDNCMRRSQHAHQRYLCTCGLTDEEIYVARMSTHPPLLAQPRSMPPRVDALEPVGVVVHEAWPELLEQMRLAITTIRCHDEPEPTPWLCGRCPYANRGVICTKCGAPRWEGRSL